MSSSAADTIAIDKEEYRRINKYFKEIVKDLISTMNRIGLRLKDINIQILDIYHPALPSFITVFMVLELGILPDIDQQISPGYNMPKKKLDRLLKIYEDLSRDGKLALVVKNISKTIQNTKLVDSEVLFKDRLTYLINTIDTCREMIGNVIRENWDFCQFLTL